MNIKNKIKIGLAATLLSFGATSCNDWLNVEMEDSIMENTLFSTDEGYLSSLTGCYAKMNETYGTTLTMGGLDVMAQYYYVSQNSDHSFYNYSKFNYTEASMKSESDNIWSTQYSIIANLNVLLEHLEKDQVLSKKYFNYVKGEALALRAFLHFDLMRLYGPIYSAETEDKITIPYQETTTKDVQPLLPAKEVMSKIIRDFKEAEKLLAEDRIRTDGRLIESVSSEKTDLRYRQFRLNYFAVKALLARAYMWIGDKTNAETYANEFITENTKEITDKEGNPSIFTVFPWVEKKAIDDPTDGNRDRIFSTEVVFSLYNKNRQNFFNSYMNTTSNVNYVLILPNYEEVGYWSSTKHEKIPYMYDHLDDFRRQYQWVESKISGGKDNETGFYSLKYYPLESQNNLTDESKINQYMIPLVRMSEIYTILAECALAKGDNQGVLNCLNAIRAHRNCPNIELEKDEQGNVKGTETPEKMREYITNEFMREVIGEGQLFFYYKRNAMEKILADDIYEDTYDGLIKYKNMVLSDYVWPMPDIEMDKRVTK